MRARLHGSRAATGAALLVAAFILAPGCISIPADVREELSPPDGRRPNNYALRADPAAEAAGAQAPAPATPIASAAGAEPREPARDGARVGDSNPNADPEGAR